MKLVSTHSLEIIAHQIILFGVWATMKQCFVDAQQLILDSYLIIIFSDPSLHDASHGLIEERFRFKAFLDDTDVPQNI